MSLFVAVAIGDVTRPEVEAFVEAMVENKALTGRKLLDAHKGSTFMTADDFLSLAVRMRELHALGPMGPVAIVLPGRQYDGLQRALGLVASANRPMRVFDDPVKAYRWLAKQDPVDGPEETGGSELERSARARAVAAHIRELVREADAEARGHRKTIYHGQADFLYQDRPLNICVRQGGSAWEFRCCDSDRRSLGTLLTLTGEQIAAAIAQGADPLQQTLGRIKDLVGQGALAIPDSPGGAR